MKLPESTKLLREMVVAEIERNGTTASFTVRSGLLLEIIDIALTRVLGEQANGEGEKG